MSLLKVNIPENDPLMVPTQKVWDSMSEIEKDIKEYEIISALEREFNLMGEATIHFDARASATEVLRRYFKGKGRKAFIASDLDTLYPGERAFYPDLLVVFDVDVHHRRSWNVLREGKGLDFSLEILSRDTKRSDQVEKLNLYARLGIPEYFMFDPDKLKVKGFTLTGNIYQPIPEGKNGDCFSKILGLCLTVEGDKLRFSIPEGFEIPFADELVNRLNEKLFQKDRLIEGFARQLDDEREKAVEEKQRAEEEKQRAEEEKQRAEEEKQRADKEKQQAELEKQRADNAEKEIERLRELLKLKSTETDI